MQGSCYIVQPKQLLTVSTAGDRSSMGFTLFNHRRWTDINSYIASLVNICKSDISTLECLWKLAIHPTSLSTLLSSHTEIKHQAQLVMSRKPACFSPIGCWYQGQIDSSAMSPVRSTTGTLVQTGPRGDQESPGGCNPSPKGIAKQRLNNNDETFTSWMMNHEKKNK